MKRHVAWMLQQLATHASKKKKSRWVGFIAGALEYYGIEIPKHSVSGEQNNLKELVRLARHRDASYHAIAHAALGYLQGWLWASGKGSVNDFRLLNNPMLVSA